MPRRLALLPCLLLSILSAALSSAVRADLVVDVGGRVVTVHTPPGHDPGVASPVVLDLHGYTGTGASQEAYWQLMPLADEFGFLLASPDGLVDCLGDRFWNATTACCNFCGSTVDDVAFLEGLLDGIAAQAAIDEDRLYVVGLSNGGFMSHRMACDRSARIAAIASFAGAAPFAQTECTPSHPIHVLQIHGTADTTIFYDGGNIGANLYPGALETAQGWAERNGCSLVADETPPPLDLVSNIAGAESTVQRYETDCAEGGSAELWTIPGGGHTPPLSTDYGRHIIEYLLAHPKSGVAFPHVPALGGAGIVLLAAGLVAAGHRRLRQRSGRP